MKLPRETPSRADENDTISGRSALPRPGLMTRDYRPIFDDESASALMRFEEAWRTSPSPPDVADFWRDGQAVELLEELVRIDCEQRQNRNLSPSIGSYVERFPLLSGSAERLSAVVSKALPAIPGYEIHSVLGRGGMGVVYEATQIAAGRRVALKTLANSVGSAGERARFRAEIETIARLQHASIVQIYDVGERDGEPYFSMELCPGGTLATKLNGAPLAGDAVTLCRDLALAVQSAHDLRILHRDLKPENVLLTADGTPKIADFGLAKRLDLDQEQTKSGVLIGTPSYMAPEQAAGDVRNISAATDVYALGAILYSTLTGLPPFRGHSLPETIRQVLEDEPAAPRTLQPRIPRDVETICLRCLEKRPERRFASAKALADDLTRYLEGRPIESRPTGLAERAVKWVRRRPAYSTAISLLFVAVLLLGWALIEKDRAASVEAQRQRERDAEAQRASTEQSRHARDLDLAEMQRTQENGDWPAFAAAYDRAAAQGQRFTDDQRVARLVALENQLLYAQLRKELAAVRPTLTSPAALARLDVIQARLTFPDDRAGALALLRAAAPKLVDGAEKEYAEGTFAPTATEAIERFRRCLSVDRRHADGRKFLFQCLVVTGEIDEAVAVLDVGEALTPTDPGWKIGRAFIRGLRTDEPVSVNDDADANALLVALSVISGRQFRLLQAKFRSEAGLGRAGPDLDKRLAKGIGEQSRIQGLLAKRFEKKLDDRMFAVHPQVLRYYDFWINDFNRITGTLAPIPNVSAKSLLSMFTRKGFGADREFRERMEKYADEHPEALLRFYVAQGEFQLLPNDVAKSDTADLWRIAKLFERAANTKGLVDAQIESLDAAIYCYGSLGAPVRAKPDDEAKKLASRTFHRLFRLIDAVPPERFNIYQRIAITSGDFDLARKISKQWLEFEPDHSLATFLRARLEHRAKAAADAADWATKALKLDQDKKTYSEDMRTELISIRDENHAILRKRLDGGKGSPP